MRVTLIKPIGRMASDLCMDERLREPLNPGVQFNPILRREVFKKQGMRSGIH